MMTDPRDEYIELPAPTAWPMVAALGITLAFAGLVTNVMVTIVGVVLTIAGAVGGFRDVLPVEDVERIPLPWPARGGGPARCCGWRRSNVPPCRRRRGGRSRCSRRRARSSTSFPGRRGTASAC